ncbi:Serine/threonine protein kinase [hydrothermal vent metagenome]|uniref:Serine/threonine protein kinase n=1 Tax=hydrothermal vent metagenome TaxID=652676 RepID=A0A3B0X138_9ZZZZ
MDKNNKASPNKPAKDSNATVIKSAGAQSTTGRQSQPRSASPAKKPPAEAKTRIKQGRSAKQAAEEYAPSTEKIKKDAIALTRINNQFQSQDTSKGFEKAQSDANRALADNKIVLNKRFVLDSTLGSGGMGTVYKGQDLRKVEANDLNPYVAVKVLNSDFEKHPDAYISLQREASRTNKLAHPNIITVNDFDRDGDIVFMTMELLEGQSMDVLLRNYKDTGLPIDEAMSIIKDYCNAVEYAHQNNIIHSDLKPGNIFITETGAKVLDFGIARITSDAQLKDDFDAGTLGALTEAYASLEMFEYKPPAPSDDVYAAGIIAYELLTGRHPYGRKSAEKALQEKLKPQRVEGISKRQWQALSKALKLKREDRTASIQKFLDELTLKKKFPIFKLTSLVFLIALSWFGYVKFFMPNELTNVLNKTFIKAQECYATKNYDCAIDSARAVIKMEPGNKEALELLKQSKNDFLDYRINKLMSVAKQCLDKNSDIRCANTKLQQLIEIAADSTQVRKLENSIAEKELEIFINNSMLTANSCMVEKNYNCVMDSTAEILNRNVDYAPAIRLAEQVKVLLSRQRDESAKNNKEFNTRMGKARACFAKGDYTCSKKYAKLALKNKPGNSQAESLYEKSGYAMSRKTDNLRRANKVLQQGQQCFKRKNYSCAIAKSESALEFLPDHNPAIKLRNKAKQEIEKLKNSIIIN